MNQLPNIVLLLAALAVATPTAAQRPAPNQRELDQAASASKILEDWRATGSQPVHRLLHVVYWTPSDRDPAPAYRDRLSRIMLDIQSYYGDEMARLGFGRLQPKLDLADDGQLRIHMVKSSKPYAQFNVKSGHAIRRESMPVLQQAGIDGNRVTLVIFANMSNWDPAARTISQNSPYYAGGNHLSGTAWQVDSPILEVAAISDRGNFVRDGQYGRMSLGAYNSMFIGGIAHEIGHALGLPHVRETDAERQQFGTALMGSGNRTYGQERRGEGKGSFLTLAHGLRLATHPIFCGEGKSMTQAVKSTLTDVEIKPQAHQVTLSARISSNVPCYAMLAYWDPEGRSNYDALSAVAIPASDGSFTITMADLPSKPKGEMRLVPLFANGSAGSFATTHGNPYQYAFELRADSTPQLHCLHCKD